MNDKSQVNKKTSALRPFRGGFTLLELLLYFAIVSVMTLVISAFLFSILEARAKSRAIAEVEQQAGNAIQIISRTIRNAENVNFPAPSATSSSLSLDVWDAAKDPAIFDVSGAALRIKEGTGAEIALTSSRVVVSNPVFSNLSRAGTFGVVRVQFTLSYVNPENRNEYDYSKTFYVSAALRQ